MSELRLLSTESQEPDANAGPVEFDVSVIVPVTERPGDLKALFEKYSEALESAGHRCEFLFVVEPWYRGIADALRDLPAFGRTLHIHQAAQRMGQSALLRIAANRCRAPVIVALPAYRRLDKAVLPDLVQRIRGGAAVAAVCRWPRRDSWINKTQGYMFNRLVGRLTQGQIRDVACGVTAMRREVFQRLPLYGDFFRFIPILALREGYGVKEVLTPQDAADAGPRLYGPGVYLRRFLDILALIFLLHFTEKPLRFFGLIGSVLVAGGVGVTTWLFAQRVAGQGISDRPMLLLGVLLLVLGFQAIALGLVGEIIVHLHASRRTSYRLAQDDQQAQL